MKKYLVIAIVIALIVYQHWGDIQNYINPPEDLSSQHSADVIMYATSWWGFCKKARKFLRNENIEFIEYDIEKSREGREQYEKLNGRGVPLMVVKGKIIRGYSPQAIKAALK